MVMYSDVNNYGMIHYPIPTTEISQFKAEDCNCTDFQLKFIDLD